MLCLTNKYLSFILILQDYDKELPMDFNSENSIPTKGSVIPQDKVKSAKEAASTGSNFKVTPDKVNKAVVY